MLIFSGVLYHLASSFSPQRQAELSSVLDANGASPVSLDLATHVVTNTNRFEGWHSVDEGVCVVTDKWVDRSMVLGKIQPTNNYSSDPSMIFSGVVACASELSPADLEVLSAGTTSLGGQWRTGLTRDVTHLFTLTPSGKKYDTAMHFQEYTHIKVLLPHWFDDAVRVGYGRLPTIQYEWPDPAVLKGPGGSDGEAEGGKKEKGKPLDRDKKLLYRNVMWKDIPVPPERRDVWAGRKILLSASLELSGGRRDAVEAGIRRAGGTVIGGGDEAVQDADVVVARYRSGRAYVKALRAHKTIGTLTWLFHVEATGVLSAPTDQLLHYPIPKKAIDGFAGHEITVTNYTGESREYLKKLITAMGAQFTPSMSGRNTVLIAAFISGNKTQKARSWSIPIVNHTWLEDCFTQWRNLTVGLEKYVVFPPGVDFAAVLGERGVRGVEADLEGELGEDNGGDEDGDEDRDVAMIETPKKRSEWSSVTPRKNGRGRPLDSLWPESSAKDVREVVAALVGEEEEDVVMVDDPEPAHSARKSGRLSGARTTEVPQAGPSTARKKKSVFSDEESEDEVRVQRSPVKLAMKSRPTPRPKPKRIVSTEISDDDLPLAPVTPKMRPKPKPRKPVPLDTDSDATSPPINVPPPTRVLKSKAKEIGPPEPPTSSPLTPIRTPRRVVSVLMPPLPAYASPSKSAIARTDSVRVAADEAIVVSSNPKRNRPGTTPENVTHQSTSTITRTPSKRSAASKATRKLREEVMPDVMNYQQEMKKAKGKEKARAADRRESRDDDSISVKVGKKRRSDHYEDDDGEDEIDERPSKKKKTAASRQQKARRRSTSDEENVIVVEARKKTVHAIEDEESDDDAPPQNTSSKKPSGVVASGSKSRSNRSPNAEQKPIRLMTTHFTPSDAAVKVLTQLGVKMTTKPSDCTHLVAPHLVRTEKFLCALAVAPFILSDKWVVESVAAKRILPEENYALIDPANELKFKFRLSESLVRAKNNPGRLFAKKVFYVTPKVSVDTKLLKNVVTACGGQLSTQIPTLRILNANQDRHVISSPADSSIWGPLAETHNIYSQELILTAALKQEVDWEDQSYMVPGSF